MRKKHRRDIVINDRDALIIVDIQRDFCFGGALPVPYGDQVVPVLNSYIKLFDQARAHIYATRDWHPPNHVSFKAFGGIWPPHCVQDSEGAEFHPDLELIPNVKVISKATPNKEAYSGFDETELAKSLRKNHIKRLFIGGLATDYCVKNTVLDALMLGFETILLVDAIRGVNIQLNDSNNAIKEMIQKGAQTTILSHLQAKKTNAEDELEETMLKRKDEKKTRD